MPEGVKQMDRRLGRVSIDALMQIPRRAERQSHHTLRETFVDIGPLFSTLKRPEHQVMYGRRGTGKTHALGNLQSYLEQQNICVVYLDMRTVGSAGGIYSDPREPVAARATPLLVDVVEALHNGLLEFALTEMDAERDSSVLIKGLDLLGASVTEVEVIGPMELEEELQDSDRNSAAADIGFSSGHLLQVGLSGSSEKLRSRSSRKKVSGDVRFSVKFGPLSAAMRQVVNSLPGRHLWLLLDEWSALPLDLQPVLADLLRRALLPVSGVVVKIAAIERRSSFCVRGEHGDYLGIELGADVSQDVNLDDYLIFSEVDDRAFNFFGDLFLRHSAAVSAEVAREFPITPEGRREYISALWDSETSFRELVQAAEGIPRDGINIAGLAAQRATPPKDWTRGGISVDDVRDSARSWFLRDKEASIKADKIATWALAHIIRFTTQRRKRTFLIERGHDSNHQVIQVLYDARLIHLLNSAVGPGGGYDLFALDYGGFINTLANNEKLALFQDLWAIQWTDIDPSRSPLVRQAILRVEDLVTKPRFTQDDENYP
jgi:hypothetical protein